MGWTGGNRIFDPVARALFKNDVPSLETTQILIVLIDALYDCDWDTEDESKREFVNFPAVMTAFKIVDKRYGLDTDD